jgi:hypothetical protein
MKQEFILKLKLGIAVLSVIFFLAGAKLLFGNWASIHSIIWVFGAIMIYATAFPAFRALRSSGTIKIFYEFEVAGMITFAVATALATTMLLIFYSNISLIFLGMALLCIVIFAALRFITIDFKSRTVDGLLGKQVSFDNLSVQFKSDHVVEVGMLDPKRSILLRKEKFSTANWTLLIDSFKRIDEPHRIAR